MYRQVHKSVYIRIYLPSVGGARIEAGFIWHRQGGREVAVVYQYANKSRNILEELRLSDKINFSFSKNVKYSNYEQARRLHLQKKILITNKQITNGPELFQSNI